MILMLTMFPRQDVGGKGSRSVQEPLRQPVLPDMEHYGFWEIEFFSALVFFCCYVILIYYIYIFRIYFGDQNIITWFGRVRPRPIIL